MCLILHRFLLLFLLPLRIFLLHLSFSASPPPVLFFSWPLLLFLIVFLLLLYIFLFLHFLPLSFLHVPFPPLFSSFSSPEVPLFSLLFPPHLSSISYLYSPSPVSSSFLVSPSPSDHQRPQSPGDLPPLLHGNHWSCRNMVRPSLYWRKEITWRTCREAVTLQVYENLLGQTWVLSEQARLYIHLYTGPHHHPQHQHPSYSGQTRELKQIHYFTCRPELEVQTHGVHVYILCVFGKVTTASMGLSGLLTNVPPPAICVFLKVSFMWKKAGQSLPWCQDMIARARRGVLWLRLSGGLPPVGI